MIQNVLFMTQKNTSEEKEKIKLGLEYVQNLYQIHSHYQIIDEKDDQEYQMVVDLFEILIKTLHCPGTLATSRMIVPRMYLEIDQENVSDCLDHIMTLTRPQIKQDLENLRPIPEFMKVIPIEFLNYLAYTDCDKEGEFTGFLFYQVFFYRRSLEELEKYGFEMKDLGHQGKLGTDENGEEITPYGDYFMYGIYPINLDQPENVNLGLTMGSYVDPKLNDQSPSPPFTYRTIVYQTWLVRYNLNNDRLEAAMSY